jgi:hypothetical protein
MEETQHSGTSSRLGLDGEEPEPPSFSKAKLDDPAPIKKNKEFKKKKQRDIYVL